ncbi:MAG: PilT/PilU family type 4a pilus ATPase [Tepidisphaeraceae bacterium]
MQTAQLLAQMAELGASDLHLQVGSPPMFRVQGELRQVDVDGTPLTASVVRDLISQITTDPQRERLESQRGVDFAHVVPNVARFRVSAYYERGQLAAAFRLVPARVPTLDELNLPWVLREIALVERGLVLVTGTTGSGKSSTLAAMIDHVNRSKKKRVITIEDPIEYVHASNQSLVAQREVGADAEGFLLSLRQALRQDPDLILLGELRDKETAITALQAADTGHAVFSTLHTTNASQTVQRLITMFPNDMRQLLLEDLAANLEAVISQRLARTVDGKARVPVLEVLRGTPMIKKLIADDRLHELSQVIAGKEQGMQLFDQHLVELYKADFITGTEAMRLANNPEAVLMAKRGISSADLRGGLLKS